MNTVFESAKMPSFSVMLPSYNDESTIARQLDGLSKELRPCDELILINDGSTDRTGEIMDRFRFSNASVVRVTNPRPGGVCQAYNQCASLASKDWILGASGNDQVLPGTIRNAAAAVGNWPYARVMFGNIKEWGALNWLERTGYVSLTKMHEIFVRRRGWHTHGAAAFIRRDSWPPGYIPELEWIADWFQTLVLAMRHGCIYLHHTVSSVTHQAESFSSAHNDTERYNQVVRHMRRIFDGQDYADVHRMGRLLQEQSGWLNERKSDLAPCH